MASLPKLGKNDAGDMALMKFINLFVKINQELSENIVGSIGVLGANIDLKLESIVQNTTKLETGKSISGKKSNKDNKELVKAIHELRDSISDRLGIVFERIVSGAEPAKKDKDKTSDQIQNEKVSKEVNTKTSDQIRNEKVSKEVNTKTSDQIRNEKVSKEREQLKDKDKTSDQIRNEKVSKRVRKKDKDKTSDQIQNEKVSKRVRKKDKDKDKTSDQIRNEKVSKEREQLKDKEEDKDRNQTNETLDEIAENTRKEKEDKKKNDSWVDKIFIALGAGVALFTGLIIGFAQGIGVVVKRAIIPFKLLGKLVSSLGKSIRYALDPFTTFIKMKFGEKFPKVATFLSKTADDILFRFHFLRSKVLEGIDWVIKKYGDLKNWALKSIKTFKASFAPNKIMQSLATKLTSITNFFSGGMNALLDMKIPKIDVSKSMGILTKIVHGVKSIFEPFMKFGSKFGLFFKIGAGIGKSIPIVGQLIGLIDFAFNSIGKIIDSFKEDGFFTGIKTTVDELFRVLIGDIGNLLSSAFSWVAGALGFEEMSKYLEEMDINKIFKDFTSKIMDGDFMGIVKSLVDGISDFFSTLFGDGEQKEVKEGEEPDKSSGIFSAISGIITSLGGKISGFVDTLLDAFKPLKDHLGNLLENYPVINNAKTTVMNTFEKITDGFKWVVDKIKTVASFFNPSNILKVVKEKIGGASGLIGKGVNYITDIFKSDEKKETETEIKETKSETTELKERVSKIENVVMPIMPMAPVSMTSSSVTGNTATVDIRQKDITKMIQSGRRPRGSQLVGTYESSDAEIEDITGIPVPNQTIVNNYYNVNNQQSHTNVVSGVDDTNLSLGDKFGRGPMR